MISIESKIFFPTARIFFCVIGILSFVAAIICTIAGLYYKMETGASLSVSVNAQDVISKIKPFGVSQKPQRDASASTNPFGRSLSPLDKMKNTYPGADIEGLSDVLTLDRIDERPYGQLTTLIREAEDVGDTSRQYVANLLNVLHQVDDPKMRLAAVTIYHQDRMKLLRGAASQRQLATVNAPYFLTAGAVAFLCVLQTALLLAILAVERNTRPRN